MIATVLEQLHFRPDCQRTLLAHALHPLAPDQACLRAITTGAFASRIARHTLWRVLPWSTTSLPGGLRVYFEGFPRNVFIPSAMHRCFLAANPAAL